MQPSNSFDYGDVVHFQSCAYIYLLSVTVTGFITKLPQEAVKVTWMDGGRLLHVTHHTPAPSKGHDSGPVGPRQQLAEMPGSSGRCAAPVHPWIRSRFQY